MVAGVAAEERVLLEGVGSDQVGTVPAELIELLVVLGLLGADGVLFELEGGVIFVLPHHQVLETLAGTPKLPELRLADLR